MVHRTLTIGSRASALAMAQTAWVAAALERSVPQLKIEIHPISTLGDRDRTPPLSAMDSHGVFTSELQRALLAGAIDLAVHSFKDLPTQADPALTIAAVPTRDDPHDALVLRQAASLNELPRGARVAAGSPRRREALRCARPDLIFVPIRGNIDTRLAALRQGHFDALVVARAALNRLGRPEPAQSLDAVMLPAPAQGALALEIRTDDHLTRQIAAAVNDPLTERTTTTERSLLKRLGGGCHLPLGVLADVDSTSTMTLRAQVCLDGRRFDFSGTAPLGDEPDLVERLARDISRTFPSGLTKG